MKRLKKKKGKKGKKEMAVEKRREKRGTEKRGGVEGRMRSSHAKGRVPTDVSI